MILAIESISIKPSMCGASAIYVRSIGVVRSWRVKSPAKAEITEHTVRLEGPIFVAEEA